MIFNMTSKIQHIFFSSVFIKTFRNETKQIQSKKINLKTILQIYKYLSHIHTHTDTHTYTHTHLPTTHTHTTPHTHVHTPTHTHTHTHTTPHTHTHTPTPTHTPTHHPTHTCTHVHTHTYTHPHTPTHPPPPPPHTHTHTHTVLLGSPHAASCIAAPDGSRSLPILSSPRPWPRIYSNVTAIAASPNAMRSWHAASGGVNSVACR